MWTVPQQLSTGDLVSQDIWNKQVADNLTDLNSRGFVPPGLVAYYVGTSPPTGWSEYTAARGRVIVGLVSGGSLGGAVATALGNLENRTHAHVYTTVPYHRHSAGYFGNSPNQQNPYISGSYRHSAANQHTDYQGSSNPSTQASSHMMPYIQLLAIKKS